MEDLTLLSLASSSQPLRDLQDNFIALIKGTVSKGTARPARHS